MVELTIVIAIIGVPGRAFDPELGIDRAQSSKYDPEISAMFAELSTREEQYKSEQGNGAYLTEAECPSAPMPERQRLQRELREPRLDGVGDAARGADRFGDPLHVSSHDGRLAGHDAAGAVVAVPAAAGSNTPIAGSWYYTIATCDMDGNGGTNATFCTASWNADSLHQRQNYGQ